MTFQCSNDLSLDYINKIQIVILIITSELGFITLFDKL